MIKAVRLCSKSDRVRMYLKSDTSEYSRVPTNYALGGHKKELRR